jgi:F-type H+-transporting ATPase subunit alpha
LIIFAGTSGALDNLPVEDLREFEAHLYTYVESMNPGLLKTIMEKKVLDDQVKADMAKVISEAKERFAAEKQVAAKA